VFRNFTRIIQQHKHVAASMKQLQTNHCVNWTYHGIVHKITYSNIKLIILHLISSGLIVPFTTITKFLASVPNVVSCLYHYLIETWSFHVLVCLNIQKMTRMIGDRFHKHIYRKANVLGANNSTWTLDAFKSEYIPKYGSWSV